MNTNQKRQHEINITSMNREQRENWLVTKMKAYLIICIVASLLALIVGTCTNKHIVLSHRENIARPLVQ